jgi:transposase-like protein
MENLSKELFKDILQETLEAEMDVALGYMKHDYDEKVTYNSRNGFKEAMSATFPFAKIQRCLNTSN